MHPTRPEKCRENRPSLKKGVKAAGEGEGQREREAGTRPPVQAYRTKKREFRIHEKPQAISDDMGEPEHISGFVEYNAKMEHIHRANEGILDSLIQHEQTRGNSWGKLMASVFEKKRTLFRKIGNAVAQNGPKKVERGSQAKEDFSGLE